MKPPVPLNETERLDALRDYQILDTPAEQDFDDLTALASYICGTPIALMTLLDDHRQWFKSRIGMGPAELSRDIAFCAHAIVQSDLFVVPDALHDGRFADNPLVTSDPSIRFYAGAPLVTPGGQAMGTLCVIDTRPRELTGEQAEALRALSRQAVSQMELRKKVVTLRLADEALRLAKDAAESANQAKSRFLANMSHELRTPLNAIIGYSEMLGEELAGGERAELASDAERIRAAGQHLLGLINEILDLSKIEAGRAVLCLDTCDVGPLIRDVVSTIRPLVRKSDNRLEVTGDGDAGQMHADLGKVRQVLLNLLSNALKFTDHGSVTLAVSRLDEGGREWVRFAVADTGVGMTAEQLGRLFDPFSQADLTTSSKFGGTGLGLTISRRFCRMMGGDITVASEFGKGTTFIATIPARVAGESRCGEPA